MSAPGEIERLRAEADFCRDRLALLRAKLYRWGLGSNAHLVALERDLASAEQRLRDAGGGPGARGMR